MQQHHPDISPGYDEDFFAWTRHQAELLRAVRGRTDDRRHTMNVAILGAYTAPLPAGARPSSTTTWSQPSGRRAVPS